MQEFVDIVSYNPHPPYLTTARPLTYGTLYTQCDYGVGLSRMMNGRVVASERPGHTILEGMSVAINRKT